MKKYIKLLFSFIAVFTLITVVSCDDDEFSGNGKGTGNVSIASISPGAEYPDETVTLVGTGFNEVQFVFVGNLQAEFQLDGDTIYFVVPTKAVVGMTTVTLAMAENYRVSVDFEVLLRPTPVFEKISPSAAQSGEIVTIKGVNLGNIVAAKIGGSDAEVEASSTASELKLIVPDGLPENSLAEIELETIHGIEKSESIFYIGQNLILNGELELGDGDNFTNWGKWNGGEGMTATTSENEVYVGRSLKAIGAGGDAWRTQFVSDPVETIIGVEYTAFMWIKAEAAGGNMRFSTNESAGAQYSGNYDIGTEWQQVQWAFTATSPETRFVLDLGATTTTFFVDNITLIAGGGGSIGAPELLVNGSFEDGLTGWESLNGSHDVSTSEFYCGSTSMTATGAGANPWDTQIASDPLDLVEGTTYEISFWAKAAGPDGVFRISMSQYDGNGSDFFYSADMEIPEDWTYFSHVVEAAAVPSGVYRLLFDMGATVQTFFVDAISVKEYEVPTGLNVNGGFEDGLTGWESLNGTHDVSTSEFHSGGASLTATGAGGNPWDTQIASDPMDMIEGRDYKISFWAKAAGPNGVFRISMSQYDGNGSDFFYSSDLEISEDWTYFTFIVNAAAVPSGVYRLLFDMGATTETFFVDDVAVVEYDACE